MSELGTIDLTRTTGIDAAELALPSADDEVFWKKTMEKIPEGEHIVTGIDPGVVNLAIAVYDIKQRKFLLIAKYQLRERGAIGSDIGNAFLIERVKDFIEKNRGNIFRGRVFIEDQDGSNKEVTAVQHTFQSVLGVDKCFPVSPNAVKTHFPEYFPKVDPALYPDNAKGLKAAQYRADKRNAVLNGRQFVSEGVAGALAKSKEKEDDYYDGVFIAKYAEEVFFVRKTPDGRLLDFTKLRRKQTKKDGISRRKPSKNSSVDDLPEPKTKKRKAAESDEDKPFSLYSAREKKPGAVRRKKPALKKGEENTKYRKGSLAKYRKFAVKVVE